MSAMLPTENNDREGVHRRIRNIIDGFRNYGYEVISEPIISEEDAYYAHILSGLKVVEATIERLRKIVRGRGTSTRVLALLHSSLPEPCWGVALASPLPPEPSRLPWANANRLADDHALEVLRIEAEAKVVKKEPKT